jgi:predicted amidophosphoribosyltransferase
VVIVDDVYTSGATMHAAIDCFARAGVHDIRICVLASGAVE